MIRFDQTSIELGATASGKTEAIEKVGEILVISLSVSVII
jgi:mannitol/fructose-specific phosphotransferase system IIA component